MISEIASAFKSIKAASSIAQGLINLKTEAEVNAAIIDLQSHLLDTQNTVSQLQDRIQEQKARIRELEQFSPEKFELVEIDYNGHKFTGRKAYRDKSTADYYCPTCFSKKKLTPIQFSTSGTQALKCGTCNSDLGYADDHKIVV